MRTVGECCTSPCWIYYRKHDIYLHFLSFQNATAGKISLEKDTYPFILQLMTTFATNMHTQAAKASESLGLHGLTQIPACISKSNAQWSVGWNYLSIPELQRLHHWSLWMDKQFHPTPDNGCKYLSMLGWKLIWETYIAIQFIPSQTNPRPFQPKFLSISFVHQLYRTKTFTIILGWIWVLEGWSIL